VQANRQKAEGWLAKNAIVITALNPIIGYSTGAALVKEAIARESTIVEVVLEKIASDELRHIDEKRLVTKEEVEGALKDLRRLTEGGLIAM
jgi:aspartate ammonia-lyase